MADNRYRGSGGGLFWTAASWGAALIAGGIFGYILSNFYGQGPTAGLMFGFLIFLISGAIWSRYGTGAPLPAPNTVKAPVAPPGGAFTVEGGATRRRDAEPRPDVATAATEVLESAQTKVSEVVSGATAFVSGLTGGAAGSRAGDHGSVPVADNRPAPATGDTSAPVTRDTSTSAMGDTYPSAAEAPIGGAAASFAPDAPRPSPHLDPVATPPAAAPIDVEPTAARDPQVRPGPEPASAEPQTFDAAPAAGGRQPAGLAGPREGGADDLKRIKGVGPRLEVMLNGFGIYYFDQIAAWTPEQLLWIDTHLEGFNGRASRDDWIGQSAILAGGGETEHSRRVDADDAD